MDLENRDTTSQICDNIIEESVRSASLKVCLNKNDEIDRIEKELGDII